MSKVTGIITEYNPFHYGHLYHLQQSLKITNSDVVICVMNGNFTQRGLPAITDKWSRTRMALSQGVNLVLELPLIYGIRSAEYFAEGTISLLAHTRQVDSVVFGSEAGEILPLNVLANLFLKEPPYFKEKLKQFLEEGNSFPRAREKAAQKYLLKNNINNRAKIIKALKEPNNILGIEYIKAIKRNGYPLKPYTIKRIGEAYYSKKTDQEMASATAIRDLFYNNRHKKCRELVPDEIWNILKEDKNNNKLPLQIEILGFLVLNKLRNITSFQLKNYAEITNGLENRFKEAARKCGDWQGLVAKIKTNILPRTRVQRNLLHILFDITKEDFEVFDRAGLQYIRVLGFDHKGEKLLGKISQEADLPLITQPAQYINSIDTSSTDPLQKMLSYDLLATDIFSLLYQNRSQRWAGRDFYKQLIKIN